MTRILVDVDTQRDFVAPDGALYVPAPATVPAAIRSALEVACAQGRPIIGSVDSHAYDAWEFETNGGPFAPHCVKGRPGWLRVFPEVPERTRFVPMLPGPPMVVAEAVVGEGNRSLTIGDLVSEACAGVGLYFEKEVYSLFSNPMAEPVVAGLVEALGGPRRVTFDVIGYCTGGYCVDAAASGLASRGYRVRVLAGATAAIGGAAGQEVSRRELTAAGVSWQEEP